MKKMLLTIAVLILALACSSFAAGTSWNKGGDHR